jgi:microcystin-dependent protein
VNSQLLQVLRGLEMKKVLIALLLGILTAASLPAVAQSEPFIGEIQLVGFNFAPIGWATCSGQLVAISQNEALFTLIGTTYGGDGQQTFALPDLRGRRIVGAGQGPGLSNYVNGQVGGEESVTLTLVQMPQHSHTPNASSAPGTSLTPAGNYWASQTATALYSNAPAPANMAAGLIGNAGGNQPHDNMQPYLVMNYIIALEGIYPSRN